MADRVTLVAAIGVPGQSQPIESFRVNAKGYRASYCKGCSLQVTQECRERNRDELNARRRAAYAARKAAEA
jgi:hypothetical protein